MKIALIGYLHGYGGAEKQLLMLANEMANRNHDVYLISISEDKAYYGVNNKIHRVFIPDKHKAILKVAYRYFELRKVIKHIRPEVVINFWFQSAYLTAMMPKRVTGKIIYSERGDPNDKEYSGMLGIIRVITASRIDGFVFQSKGAKNCFNNRIQSRSTIIHNPVFVKQNQYPSITKRRKAIVTVGRLHRQKNQLLLIEAFSQITRKIPDYSLEIYGDGELKTELSNTIKKMNLSKKVFLKGTSKRIYDHIYDATLFVLSSDYEGLPNTLLEAMALGIPSISTDCRPGGAREIITNKDNGIITPVGDKEELAKAILRLVTDKKLYNTIEKNCRYVIKAFQPEKIYDQWEKYITKITK